MRRAALALAAVGLAGCSLGVEKGATRQGRDIFGLWQGSVFAALCVGALVWGLIVFAVFRYRRRGDTIPTQRQYVLKLEIAYTIIPIVIVAVIFVFAYRTQNEVDALSPDPDVVVEVLGFQWQWQFAYRGQDVTITGTPDRDPQLVLPVDRTARLVVNSRDVVHSFYVPDFRFKRDLIPGVTNRFDLHPEREGTFVGRCAEFCGLQHARMDFSVKVVSPDEFDAWLEAHEAERS
jgi:cytochrome c oxidase subunit 2